jgi:hypothetical protein
MTLSEQNDKLKRELASRDGLLTEMRQRTDGLEQSLSQHQRALSERTAQNLGLQAINDQQNGKLRDCAAVNVHLTKQLQSEASHRDGAFEQRGYYKRALEAINIIIADRKWWKLSRIKTRLITRLSAQTCPDRINAG